MKLIPVAFVEGQLMGDVIRGRLIAEEIECEVAMVRVPHVSSGASTNSVGNFFEIYVAEDKKEQATLIIREIDPISSIY